MTRLISSLFLTSFLGGQLALAASQKASEPAADLVTIGTIDGEADTRMSIVNIRLDRQPGLSQVGELQDHGTFLQLVIPNAVVPEPGKFFDGNNPHIPKIAVFQLTPSDAGVRLFANTDAAAIKRAAQAEILGNRIVLTIDHAKLAAAVDSGLESEAPKRFVGPPVPEELRPKPVVSADQVIANTVVSRDGPSPADQLKEIGAAGKAKALATGGIDLREKLVSVAVFSAIMLGLLAATWFVKPLLRRRAAAKGDPEAQVSMKTIASLPLAPRQRISLIQVGDEKFLIGVTPDAVTFLTTIGGGLGSLGAARPAMPSRQLAFARALEEGSSSPAVDLRPAPTLKNIEGNDEATLSEHPRLSPTIPRASQPLPPPKPSTSKPKSTVAAQGAKLKSRINVSVGDDGVTNHEGDGQKAIDDVTRLIREKLKTLRTI